jgi:hypothetical protein
MQPDPRQFVDQALNETRKFLASPNGRRIRHNVANGLMVAAPIVFMTPVVRRTKLAKLIELGGGAALVAKLAETIRDWEPGEETA